MVNFDQVKVTCNFTPKVTITYSGNPPQNNNALIYTNAKPAHPYLYSSLNYDLMGDSASKIISSDQLNAGDEQEN